MELESQASNKFRFYRRRREAETDARRSRGGGGDGDEDGAGLFFSSSRLTPITTPTQTYVQGGSTLTGTRARSLSHTHSSSRRGKRNLVPLFPRHRHPVSYEMGDKGIAVMTAEPESEEGGVSADLTLAPLSSFERPRWRGRGKGRMSFHLPFLPFEPFFSFSACCYPLFSFPPSFAFTFAPPLVALVLWIQVKGDVTEGRRGANTETEEAPAVTYVTERVGGLTEGGIHDSLVFLLVYSLSK